MGKSADVWNIDRPRIFIRWGNCDWKLNLPHPVITRLPLHWFAVGGVRPWPLLMTEGDTHHHRWWCPGSGTAKIMGDWSNVSLDSSLPDLVALWLGFGANVKSKHDLATESFCAHPGNNVWANDMATDEIRLNGFSLGRCSALHLGWMLDGSWRPLARFSYYNTKLQEAVFN